MQEVVQEHGDVRISQLEVPPWPYERTVLPCTGQKVGGKINVTGRTDVVNRKPLLPWVDA